MRLNCKRGLGWNLCLDLIQDINRNNLLQVKKQFWKANKNKPPTPSGTGIALISIKETNKPNTAIVSNFIYGGQIFENKLHENQILLNMTYFHFDVSNHSIKRIVKS